MWEWHALGHIPLSDSYNPIPRNSNPWDYIHINSSRPGDLRRRAALRAQLVGAV